MTQRKESNAGGQSATLAHPFPDEAGSEVFSSTADRLAAAGLDDEPPAHPDSAHPDETPASDEPGVDPRPTSAKLIDELQDAAEQMLEEQKLRAAGLGKSVADALRDAADQLDENRIGIAARYVTEAADRVDAVADMVRERSLSDLISSSERAARREPELFLAGAVAAGFLLGRFLLASDDRRRRDAARARGDE